MKAEACWVFSMFARWFSQTGSLVSGQFHHQMTRPARRPSAGGRDYTEPFQRTLTFVTEQINDRAQDGDERQQTKNTTARSC